jgi:hypothetical protein
MPLTKLQFRPGVNRETTSYTNEGGWFDVDKVRFRFGMPEKIGGWEKFTPTSYLGTARAMHPWVGLDNSRLIGIGTSSKYYINQDSGLFNDITPIRSSNELNSSISVGVVGVSASTSVGEITKNDNIASLTGVSGAATVGSVLVSGSTNTVTNEILGLSAPALTGSVGEVTISGNLDASVSLTGVSATGEVRPVAVTSQNVTVFDDLTFSATNGSSIITITVNQAHGATKGSFVTLSGVDSLGGNITADVLNQEYEIASVPSSQIFTIVARLANTSIQDITVNGQLVPTPVVANSSDVGDGGLTSVAQYQLNAGLDSVVYGTGWGAGTWGRETWGSASSTSIETSTLRIWTHDNFGEDLLINVRNGGIYYWDKTGGFNTRAVSLDSLTGSTSAPTIAKQILVSDRDRHIIAFGCDTEANPGVQDPLAIRFSSQESLTDWASTATNTAGELRLGSGSEILAAVETRQQILVYTDESLYAMQFLGPPFTFGVNLVSENITTMSPLSAVAVEDNVFWMGLKEFYVYGGTVQRLPCSVRDFVFDDFNLSQREKVVAATNTAFSEVWWFYPSASSDNNDRYVVYNYEQQVWYYGALARSFWMDRGIFDNPIAAGPNNYLYTQESGFDDDGSAITAYIESSQMDLGDGEQFSFIRRMIPDLTFRGSTAGSPSANITVKTRNFPGGNYLQSTSSAITKSASVPVEQFTDQVHLRLRGRSFAMRIESTSSGVGWRLGSPRLDVRPDGRR